MGPNKRWRDLVSGDLQQLGMVNSWYQLCQDREQCQEGVNQIASHRGNHVLPVLPLRRELLCANVDEPFTITAFSYGRLQGFKVCVYVHNYLSTNQCKCCHLQYIHCYNYTGSCLECSYMSADMDYSCIHQYLQ